MSAEQQAARDAVRTAIHEARFTRVGAKPEPMIGTDFEYADALAEAAIRALRATPPAAAPEITQEQTYDVIYAALTKTLIDHMDSKQISYLANSDDCKGGRHILTAAVCAALAGVPR